MKAAPGGVAGWWGLEVAEAADSIHERSYACSNQSKDRIFFLHWNISGPAWCISPSHGCSCAVAVVVVVIVIVIVAAVVLVPDRASWPVPVAAPVWRALLGGKFRNFIWTRMLGLWAFIIIGFWCWHNFGTSKTHCNHGDPRCSLSRQTQNCPVQ